MGVFQSTRPVWGATVDNPPANNGAKFQSTRPVWGATPLTMAIVIVCAGFQSTRPVWGATPNVRLNFVLVLISIHAPRVGRDRSGFCDRPRRCHFNPRAPCGARLGAATAAPFFILYFNPRAPCGARLSDIEPRPSPPLISIHAPRVGRDVNGGYCKMSLTNFNPRAPCGARR